MKDFLTTAFWIYFAALFIFPQVLTCQTADKTEGCIPLTVIFRAPQSATYFWDFGDGASSDMASPEHIFTDAGSYEVKLYKDNSATALVGTISIRVYPDMVVEITSDETTGCEPSTIDFWSNITKSDEIELQGFLWTFGDGGSSTSRRPSYEYTELGIYDVSLEVSTNITECNKTIIETDYIIIDEHEANFGIDKVSSCDVPETFVVTNLSQNLDGYTYEWSLGSELIFTGYDPGDIVIEQEGFYQLILNMIAPDGCEDKKRISLRLGMPVLDLSMEDTICQDIPIQIENVSGGTLHRWDFGLDAEPSTSTNKTPLVTFTSPGIKTVTYSSILTNCSSDTTFTIFVAENLASFNLDYDSLCGDSITITMAADSPVGGTYIWNKKDTSGAINHFVIPNPERDSFYVNERMKYVFGLELVSSLGCETSYEDSISIQLPEAFFVPDSVIGLAPLTIGFEDESDSTDPIVERWWNFGDGSFAQGGNRVKHTFEEPGKYYVQLEVTTEDGCTDLSKGTFITVLGEVSIGQDTIGGIGGFGAGLSNEYLDGTRTICVGQTLQYEAFTLASENVHIESDEGRFNHCWMNRRGEHTFLYPGDFRTDVIFETEGFKQGMDSIGFFTVVGARAEIAYEKFCDDSYTVHFQSNSQNERALRWWYDDAVISSSDVFSHTFDSKGVHEVILEALPNEIACSPHYDTAYIYVTNPVSSFQMDSQLCDNVAYLLDATGSALSGLSCNNTYNWTFEEQRPQSTTEAQLIHTFLAGKQEVVLSVTDVNGCTDTSGFEVEVFGMELEFPLDSSVCLPHPTVFSNGSESDTTVVSWDWSFGSSEKAPEYTFTQADLTGDSINVTLKTKDAIGCIDSLVKSTRVYRPFTEININSSGVCQGDPILVEATDFTEEGRHLIFDWDFSSGGNSADRNNEVVFEESGEQEITLIIQEAGTQCYDTLQTTIDVLRRPQADFATSVDSLETICYPHSVEFQNTSVIDGETSYEWDFGNGASSDLFDPAISYDRGSFIATLTAKSVWGCEDVKETTLELIGPIGDFTIDKDNICLGDEITLELRNPIDVNSLSWDLGDGTLVHDVNRLSHTYSFRPPGDITEIDLILRSAANGCEAILSKEINLNEVVADFEVDESYDHCRGLVRYTNLSIGADAYTWTFGDGNESGELHPENIYEGLNQATVTLTALDSGSNCQATITKDIEVNGENNFYAFANVFSPNGDGRNDFFRMVVPDRYKDVVSHTVFQIFDRWGQLIYDNESSEGWDGTYRGQQLPADVYAYYLEVEIENCKMVSDKGTVLLVR